MEKRRVGGSERSRDGNRKKQRKGAHGGEEKDRWQIETPKGQKNEDEEMANINEGGVEGGNVHRSAKLQALAINWFEKSEMFAFCRRPTFYASSGDPDHNRSCELLPDSSISL